MDELDRIRGWRIEKLHLENNECISRVDADSFARFYYCIKVTNCFFIFLFIFKYFLNIKIKLQFTKLLKKF